MLLSSLLISIYTVKCAYLPDAFDVGLYIAFPIMVISCLAVSYNIEYVYMMICYGFVILYCIVAIVLYM